MSNIKDKILSFFSFNRISLFCVLMIIVFVLKILYQDTSITKEDFWLPFFDEQNSHSVFRDAFFNHDHMWYVLAMFETLTLKNLPNFFDIHPQVFLSQYVVYFLIALFLIFFFSICNFYSTKKTPVYSLLLLITTYLTLFALNKFYLLWIFYDESWVYAYVLLPSFAFVLFKMLEDFYVNEQTLTKKDWFIVWFLIFLVGISHEMYRMILCIILPLSFLLDKIIFKKKQGKENIKKYLRMYVFVVLLCTFNCFTLEMVNKIDYFYNPYETNQLVEFSKYCAEIIRFFTIKNIPCFLMLLTFWVSIGFFVKDKNKNKRFFICNFSFIVSLLMFLATLFLVQKSYLDDGLKYIIYHPGIGFNLYIIYLILIFMAVGYLKDNADKGFSKSVNLLLTVFLSSAVILCSCGYKPLLSGLEYMQKEKMNLKKSAYITEKCYIAAKYSRPKNEFSDVSPMGFFPYDTWKYLYSLYGKPQSEQNEFVDVLNNQDWTSESYQKFLIDAVGCQFEDDELEKLDFSELFKYNLQN